MKSKAATIHIDPAKFKDRIPRDTDTGDYHFEEGEMLKFLIDQLNEAGVDIAMIHQNYEYGIEYCGKLDYFSIGISSLDTTEVAVRAGMVELANLLNDREDLKSWVEYQHGLYYLHIDEEE